MIGDKNSNPVFEYRHAVLSQVPVYGVIKEASCNIDIDTYNICIEIVNDYKWSI